MYNRNQVRSVKVKDVVIGGNNNVVIQSMCNIKTSNVEEVVQQILRLEEIGCEIIRVSVLDTDETIPKEFKKLAPKKVKGGVVLLPTPFTIKK